MEWFKIKPESIINNSTKIIERKKPIPLDITPSEMIIKIRKKEVSDREKELDIYMENLKTFNIELIKFNHSLDRLKSLTELASIREKILSESCKF